MANSGPDPGVHPVWLWDRAIDATTARRVLADPDDPRHEALLAQLLREERPGRVWDWVTPQHVARELDRIGPRLGRKREFWMWLIGGWREQGLLDS